MTTFGHQLSLLLWKNYLLRKRHKMRLVIELLCPLILFLIFMWVRTKGLKFNRPHCHLVEKALPSVGGFEFLQNFVCTLNNTCHEDFVEDKGPREWEDAVIIKFVRDSGPVIHKLLERQESIDTIHKLWRGASDLVKLQAARKSKVSLSEIGNVTLEDILTPTAKQNFLQVAPVYIGLSANDSEELLKSTIILKELNNNAVNEFMQDIQNGTNGTCGPMSKYKFIQFPSQELFKKLCDLDPYKSEFLFAMFRDFLNKNDVAQKIQDGLEGGDGNQALLLTNLMDTTKNDPDTIKTLIQLFLLFNNFFKEASDFIPDNSTGVSAATSFLYKGLCGLSVNPNATSFGFDATETTNRLDSLRDRLRMWRSNIPYIRDPEVDEVCNNVFEQLHSRPFTNLLWRQVKPFIRGKILYTPMTNFTAELMQRVNTKFSELKQLEETLNVILTIVHRGRVWFDTNKRMLQQTQELIKSGDINSILTLATLAGLPIGGNQNELNNFLQRFASADLRELDLLFEKIDFDGERQSHVLNCIKYDKVEPYETECEAVEEGMKLLPDNKLWAVVVFEDAPLDGSVPHHVKYKIRMDSDKVDGTRLTRDRITSKQPRRRPTIDLKYFTNGFIYLQEMIEHSFIELVTGKNISEDVSTIAQQFPYPCFIFDQFIRAISRTFPLFMVLSWVYSSAMIVKSIVLEKELRLKEVMRVMGLSNAVIWIGWFIDSFVVMSFSTVVLTVILKYGKIIEFSDFSLILVFMLCFTIATICFSFLLSSLFSRANSAAAAGGILFFISYLPYNFMLLWEERLTWHHLLLSCLIPNVAFGFGCTYLARYEEDGIGAQWSRLTLKTLPDDDFNLIYCILMLLFDAVLCLFLTWYIENVFPGGSGTPKRWFFLVQKSYWVQETPVEGRRKSCYDHGSDSLVQESTAATIEAEPTDLTLGVEVKDLSKTFSNGRVALTNLSMNFYEGQITSFLGHNGAGKTTTISILTGLFPPSKGTAKIYGHDIITQMSHIRKDLGICPQYNVLFDRLTVEEHLKFYAGLKGQDGTCAEEMDKILMDLGLPHRRNDFPRSLSGGMKRKLSVACAFVGGSKTVFLDEPTSGVDPYSRRSIWELLLKYKTGRTIILTTHFMDEADLLGDRIAIISQGRLVASGSSLFLKSHYGRGYSLRLVREDLTAAEEELLLLNNIAPSTKPPGPESVSIAKSVAIGRHTDLCTNFVHFRVAEAVLVDDVGSEIVYLLPYSSLDSFPNLFHDLDENLVNLKISSYGISDTTLEDVFLKITAEDLEESRWAVPSNFCKTCCCNQRLMSNLWKMRKGVRKRKSKIQQAEIEPPPVIVHSLDGGYISPDDHIIPPVHEQLAEVDHKHVESADPQLSHTTEINAPNLTNTITHDSVEHEGETAELLNDLDERHALAINFRYNPQKRSASNLLILQMFVILKKRLINSCRNLRALFFEIILPVVFIALALALTLILPPPENELPRLVTPWAYPPPNYIFFSEQPEPLSSSIKPPEFDIFVNEMVGPIGIGTPCMNDYSKSKICQPVKWSNESRNIFFRDSENFNGTKLGECSCEVGSFQCTQEKENPPLPLFKTPTSDFVLDVTKVGNVPKWVRQTFKEYDHKRYGGYEMMVREPVEVSFSEYIFLLDCLTTLTQPHNNSGELLTPKEPRPFFKVWFENRAWLSSIAYLNALNNAILRGNLNTTSSGAKPEYGMTLYTHPMNLTKLQQEKESIKTAALGVVHAICVIFALGFVPASFLMYLIEERHSGAKHLHLVSGVKPIVYWVSSFIFDMGKYLMSAFLCLALFYIFDAEAYINSASIGSFILLLVLYGWASIPMMYPASYIFSVPSTAFVVLGCTNLFLGVISTVSVFVLEQLGDKELEYIGHILQQAYLVLPQYCLGSGLMTLVKLHIEDAAFSRLTMDDGTKNRFEWDTLGKPLFCLAIHGFVFFIINLSLEYKQWFTFVCKIGRRSKWGPKNSIPRDEDIDVQREADRVLNHPSQTATLCAKNLTKIYRGRSAPAVNNLCFAVERGECFGLLGVNGAGKTTTFKMLTGDVSISYGSAKILGHDVEKSLDSARKHLGYCPQEDGLDPLLNTYEQLELYGRLRGMSLFDVKEMSVKLVDALGLKRYADKRCGTYSGGNKRKVSTAVALIGNPDVVFFDEPTSGMDPGARRQLWKVILKLVHTGKSIVLTSHSMEECEALCNRVAIMVNGKFTCLGSLQHLKNRFGSGYMLTVRCGRATRQEFLNNLSSDLPSAILDDTHCSQLKFKILQQDVKLGDIFSVMYKEKMSGLIEEYSVSQTTLDDIFVKFASQQRDELDGKHHQHQAQTEPIRVTA